MLCIPIAGDRRSFLLGPRYALLRRRILRGAKWARGGPRTGFPAARYSGGADPNNVTLQVVEALHELGDVELRIDGGAGGQQPTPVFDRAGTQEFFATCELLVNVRNMPELMARSDLAISAGGGTCDELAFLRVPMFLITIAKNQELAVEAYGQNKAAVVAGWFTVLNRRGLAASLRKVIGDKNLRREISAKAGELVDGQGARRVVEAYAWRRRGSDSLMVKRMNPLRRWAPGYGEGKYWDRK